MEMIRTNIFTGLGIGFLLSVFVFTLDSMFMLFGPLIFFVGFMIGAFAVSPLIGLYKKNSINHVVGTRVLWIILILISLSPLLINNTVRRIDVSDIPFPDDAVSIKKDFHNTPVEGELGRIDIIFQELKNFKDVVAFYDVELIKLGWTRHEGNTNYPWNNVAYSKGENRIELHESGMGVGTGMSTGARLKFSRTRR